MSLGVLCLMFQDSAWVSTSRVKMYIEIGHFGLWMWGHHIITNYGAPIIQWHNTTTQNNGDLNGTTAKAYKTCKCINVFYKVRKFKTNIILYSYCSLLCSNTRQSGRQVCRYYDLSGTPVPSYRTHDLITQKTAISIWQYESSQLWSTFKFKCRQCIQPLLPPSILCPTCV